MTKYFVKGNGIYERTADGDKYIGDVAEGWIGIHDGHQFDSDELLDLITIKH
jgi:hypothetical protein